VKGPLELKHLDRDNILEVIKMYEILKNVSILNDLTSTIENLNQPHKKVYSEAFECITVRAKKDM
jgi:hypothetical protein